MLVPAGGLFGRTTPHWKAPRRTYTVPPWLRSCRRGNQRPRPLERGAEFGRAKGGAAATTSARPTSSSGSQSADLVGGSNETSFTCVCPHRFGRARLRTGQSVCEPTTAFRHQLHGGTASMQP